MQFEVWLNTERFDTNEITHFMVEQRLGIPNSATVDFFTDEEFKLDDLLGGSARLVYRSTEGAEHAVTGVIEWIELASEGNNQASSEPILGYRAHIVPPVALMHGSVASQIFQNQTVQQIVTQVLIAHGVPESELDFRLNENHPAWEYCVQYQESALNFVSRLLEREGIYLYSEIDPKTKKETLRFRDDSTLAPEVDAPSQLTLRSRSALHADDAAVYGFEPRHQLAEGKVILADYDFKHPQLKLVATADAGHDTMLEMRHFPGEFTDVGVGKQWAKVRLEAAQAKYEGWTVRAALPNLAVGRSVTIDADGRSHQLFIHAVVHRFLLHEDARQPGSWIWDFEARAETIPLKTKFRVPFYHQKPVMHGPQTAVVVAPDGSPTEEIHTDEHARCKVRFHWDRSGITDDRASCWMRVTQLQTSGSMALPRIGWEVIVEFLQGDPDRPIITGLLFNGGHMPPYALPEGATRTAIRSNSTPGGGGVNEIRFEDKVGSEEIMIGSQYNMAIATANNRSKTVTKDETLVVGANSTTSIGADEKVTIGKGTKIQIDADQTVKVGANRKVEVNAVSALKIEGDASTSVGAMQFEMDGSPLAGLIAAATAKAAAIAEAKAAQAIASVQGAVQGKIDQLMGPINNLTSQANGLSNNMRAFGDGNMAVAGALGKGVAGLAASGLGSGGLGLAAFNAAKGGGDPAGIVAGTNALNTAIGDLAGHAMAKGEAALSKSNAAKGIEQGEGQGASGGGDSSMANRGGPAADLAGFSESDTATGPGHANYTVSGTHSETTATAHVTAAVGGINLNVSGSMTQNVGAALIELVLGDHAESVEGVKSESQLGLIVATKGGESESTSGPLAYTVGGALIDKASQGMEVNAGAAATFIGAYHKIDATSSITLKCGASSVVIDGGGITIKSVLVNFLGASMKLTKAVSHD